MDDTNATPAAPKLRPYSYREAALTSRNAKEGDEVVWAEPGRILGRGKVVGHTKKDGKLKVQPADGGPICYFGYFVGSLMSASGVPRGRSIRVQPADMEAPPEPEPTGTAAVFAGISNALKRVDTGNAQ